MPAQPIELSMSRCATIADRLFFARDAGREERMRAVIDALWECFGHNRPGRERRVSWIGFYVRGVKADELVLGPRRDKPACSPIGMHGACGKCFVGRRPLVVRDVASLGAGYIACDPRDKSEAVVPCLGADGSCWGVLDADSYETGAFSAEDAAGLRSLLERAGLSAPSSASIEVV